MSEATASLDSLLDSSIDDLADMPEFAVFPAGVLKVRVAFEQKEVNKHPAVEMKMVLVETIELADATDTPLAAGTESSVLFMLDNEFGQGGLKEVAKALAGTLGTTSLRDTLEQAKDMEITIVSKPRSNKEKTQRYTGVSKVMA